MVRARYKQEMIEKTPEQLSKWRWRERLKPATGRPYVRAFSLSGTVPAFTCDCLRFVCAFTPRPKVDLCVSTFSRTMLAFGNNVSFSSSACSTLAFVAGNMDVNTPASKRSQLIGNTAIVRKRCVIHKKSTCVCLRLSVAAFTRKRRDARFDLWPALEDDPGWDGMTLSGGTWKRGRSARIGIGEMERSLQDPLHVKWKMYTSIYR